VRLEGLGQLKNPVTSSGIEPATFRLVAYCPYHTAGVEELNKKHGHLRHLLFPNIFFLYFATLQVLDASVLVPNSLEVKVVFPYNCSRYSPAYRLGGPVRSQDRICVNFDGYSGSEVSSEYFDLPCLFSFQILLHIHYLF
jgi:hypothetical protein